MQFTTSITISGQPVNITVPKGTLAERRANSVFCPVGPSPTIGSFLMTKGAIDLLGSVTSPHDIVWKQIALRPNSESRTLTFNDLYLVNSERLLHGSANDDSALYLAEFGDGRYLASRKGLDCGSVIANVRSYANNSDYLTGTSGFTWASLLTALWDACGTLGAYPGLPGGLPIDGAPEITYYVGQSAYRALCAVLNQLDCAIAHNPLAGTYSIVQLGATQTLPTTHETRLQWDAQPINTTALLAAANVRVWFHYHRKSYGQERDTELANNWAYNGGGDVSVKATSITGATGTKPLWDDLPWVLDEDNTVSNSTDIDTRATNRASRYATRHTVAPAHKIYSGLLNDFLPGAKVRAVLWRSWDDGKHPDGSDNHFGGTVTEYVQGVDLVIGMGQGNGSGPAWFDREQVGPAYEHYAPPDLSRRTFPSYPRLPNIVQINAAAGSPGDTVSPNGDGFHKGRVRRWVSNAMSTLDDCWIRFVDDHDTLAGQVDGIQHEFYGPARLSGVSTSGGTLLPVYLVRKGGEDGNRVVKFKLTGDLDTGTSADAVLRAWNGAAYADGAAITVHDWYGIALRGMWQGISGMEGVALKRENATGEYNIVWMEQYAYSLEFELLEDMGATVANQASATVLSSWGQGLEPGSTVTVHDDIGEFTDAIAGCRGYASRSEYADPITPDTPYYKVVESQRVIQFAEATLTNNMCGTAPEFSSWTKLPNGQFTQDVADLATDVVKSNPYVHYGQVGDKVLMKRRLKTKAGGDWEFDVVNVTKKAKTIPTEIRFNQATKCIEYKQRQIAFESCEDQSDWLELICGEEC